MCAVNETKMKEMEKKLGLIGGRVDDLSFFD